jgi:Putative Ig domain
MIKNFTPRVVSVSYISEPPSSYCSASGSAPVITSALSINPPLNKPFVYVITASNSPTKFNALLPSGMTINTATGEIDGTCTDPTNLTIPISATNEWGTATANLVLAPVKVYPVAIVVTPLTLIDDDLRVSINGVAAYDGKVYYHNSGGVGVPVSLTEDQIDRAGGMIGSTVSIDIWNDPTTNAYQTCTWSALVTFSDGSTATHTGGTHTIAAPTQGQDYYTDGSFVI